MRGTTEVPSTRDRVLATIRTAATAPTVEEIATELDVHPNSVRLHTAALREDGLITQDTRPGTGRGRPQVTFRTSDRGAWSGRRDYQLLASLLLDGVAGDDAARQLGLAWGRRMAAGAAGVDGASRDQDRDITDVGDNDDDNHDDDNATAHVPIASTRELIRRTLADLGFEPTAVAGTDDSVELRNCPFRELVDPRDGVVCALHAGMLDGLAEDSPVDVELLPFTSPQACTVRMGDRA